MHIVTLARKPLNAGSTAENILRYGTGVLHIDTSRKPRGRGRWPANITFLHRPVCRQLENRRVRGTSMHGTTTATRRSGVHSAAKGHQTVGRVQPVFGYSDPEGLELVEVWECPPECPVSDLQHQGGCARWFLALQREGATR